MSYYVDYNEKKGCTMSRYNENTLDVTNPAPRCPVVLLLDTSSSMTTENRIGELNAGLSQFLQETAADEAASRSVELEVITFDDSAEVAMPFTPISDVDRNFDPLVADGLTHMGAALRLASEHLNERRKLYRQKGIASYRPWVVLMSDGGPNDDWESAADAMRTLGEQGKIQYIGIEIGSGADHATMCRVLPACMPPVRLKGVHFKNFFRWLTDSLRSVSASAVSDQNNLRFGDIRDWAEL